MSEAATPAIQMFGNRLVLGVTVQNTDGSAITKVAVDGSHDRRAWEPTAAEIEASEAGSYSIELSSVDFAFVRVRASMLYTDAVIRFDASLVFSAQ